MREDVRMKYALYSAAINTEVQKKWEEHKRTKKQHYSECTKAYKRHSSNFLVNFQFKL